MPHSLAQKTDFRLAIFGLLILGLLLPGCGPSREDLMMRAAQRKRPTAAGKEPEPTKKKVAPPKVAKAPSPKAEVDPEPKAEPEPVQLSIKPIGERAPENLGTAGSRRSMAIRNLNRIAEAMVQYEEEKGHYPRAWRQIDGGFKGLSWRVELLPYLGYEDLYKKFDFTKPYNRAPNRELLKYIPDEYVSPERWDTNTNWMVPVHRKFAFGEGKFAKVSTMDEEDGAVNTIIMLETDSKEGVPWTSPEDFSPVQAKQMSKELGSLRKDGTLAMWGNGYPTILSNEVTDQDLYAAFTWESGDRMWAAKIHKDVPDIELLQERKKKATTSTVVAKAEEVPVATEQPREAEVTVAPVMRKPISSDRTAVPRSSQISRATERLRQVYATKLKESKTASDKAELAGEILDQAEKMTGDPTGVYVMQTAALNLAVASGDADALMRALDARIMTFDVDAYDTHLEFLEKFADGPVTSKRGKSDGFNEMLRRLIEVIHANIQEDDYLTALELTRFASQLSSRTDATDVTRNLNRLRSLIGMAKSNYEQAHKALALYRQFPTDVENAAAFGRFLCFYKGDWKTGIPLMAKAGNPDLVAVCEMEMAKPTSVADQVALGDAWWQLSERGSGVHKQGARDRAIKWYQEAIKRMPESLDRMHVKSRLDEYDTYTPSSPLAMCAEIGEEFGADLSQSLISIAASKGIIGRRPGGKKSGNFDEDHGD